jgi:hypothetical protein
MNENGALQAGTFIFTWPEITRPVYATLTLSLEGTDINNQYGFYVYPEQNEGIAGDAMMSLLTLNTTTVIEDGKTLYLTKNSSEALRLLQNGRRVLLLPERVSEGVESTYCTDFWCYPMFKSISEWMKRAIPIGTLGLTIQNTHPALAGFSCCTYTTPQLYNIVSNGKVAVLDGTEIQPIIQTIDNFARNHKLGLLFEATVGQGKLLVCTSKLYEIYEHAEVAQFADSIIRYGLSETFAPKQTLQQEKFMAIFG